jgi:hypothetical protein
MDRPPSYTEDPVEAGMTEARRAEAWECLKQRGYAVKYQPDARAESIRKK